MTKDDPFGLENDAGRTRIRPVKSQRTGRQPTAAPIATPSRPSASPYHAGGQMERDPVRIRDTRAADNPLISAFSGLLGLAPELERSRQPENPEILNARFKDNLIYARDAAVAEGVMVERADRAAWFVAATLDDIVLNTPWGAASIWPRHTLVTQLSSNVDAGTRFFQSLDELMRYSERDPQLLELAHYCLSLGFRGRYRVEGESGEAAIAQLRAQIARILKDADDEDLSPRWRGVAAPDEPPRLVIPIWSIPIIAIAVLSALYVALSVRLSHEGEQLYTLASILPPAERAQVFRPDDRGETFRPPNTDVETPPPLIEPVVLELLPLFASAAPTNTAAALSGREDVSLAVVVVQASDPEVFRPARAEINDVYDPLLASISRVVLENIEFVGSVTVVGHTDSIPVQTSNPFQSNQGLSEARARTVAELLAAAGVPEAIIAYEGRAATQPIADNGTRDGRARNRRVEIMIAKRI